MNKFDMSQPLTGLSFPGETRIKAVKGKTIMPVTKQGKPIKKGKAKPKVKGKGKPQKKSNTPTNKDGIPIYKLTAKYRDVNN
jgi:hypothetical protein